MNTKNSDWVVIGLSGVTCGGKTTLANNVIRSLAPSYALHQDLYFFPDDHPAHKPVKGLKEHHNNYDILSALDMPKMFEDAKAILRGEDKAHDKNLNINPGNHYINNKKFLIIEGFTVLNYKPILQLCDFKYYLVLSFEDCINRRTLRLYDPPDVEGYFEKCVWPEHLKYRAELEKDRSITIVDGNNPDMLDVVLDDLKSLGLKVK